MSTLRPENRALCRAARQALEPTREDRDRVGKALGFGTAVGVVATTTTAAAASTALQGGAVGSTTAAALVPASIATAKWVALLVVMLAVGAGAGMLSRPRGPILPPAPSVARESVGAGLPVRAAVASAAGSQPRDTTLSIPASAAAVAIRPGPPGAAPPHVSRSAVPVAPEPIQVPPAEVSVTEEARLLREARTALRAGDLGRAASLLDEHARTFPDGVLAEEREAERVLVLCAAGDVGVARAATQRFVDNHPDSPLVGRVRSSCAAR